MALSPSRQEHRKSMAMAMTVPQLLTPEEPFADNFVTSATIPKISTAVPSPPASPEFTSFSTTEARFQQADDVLYPETHNGENSHAERPLFDLSNRWTTPECHQSPSTESSLSVATPSHSGSPLPRDALLPNLRSPDSPSESKDGLVGPVALNNHFGLDWYRYCRTQNEDYRAMKMAQRTLPPPTSSRRSGRDGYTERVISSLGRPPRIEKQTTSYATVKSKLPRNATAKAPARIDASTAVLKSESPAKRNRRQTSTPEASYGTFATVGQPKPRTRAAPSKKIDDRGAIDWRQVPDFCPPLSSLDAMNEKLVVHWTNSNELNLTDDPDRAQLHPQELKVASTLRLKCAQYLANKRRIFHARVTAMREGKDFNKTSAQVSTNIDVNKASRMWQAFDNVGWFDEHWFQQYL